MADSRVAAEAMVRLTAALESRADPERARGMSAYMKGHFPFLGVPAPALREAAKEAFAGHPLPPPGPFALACWDRAEREYQYAAVGLLRQRVKHLDADFLPTVEHLVTTKSWWDTVDGLASWVTGPLVLHHPELRPEMDRWLESDDVWLARAAILHQLGSKAATDADWLSAACLRWAPSKEFFLRKAIGWSLREYSKTDGDAVRRFVSEHADELSGLSRREALKWLDRRG